MAVLSVLRQAQRFSNIFLRPSTAFPKNLFKDVPTLQAVTCRMASGAQVERSMYITPSRFMYRKFKDALHFYTLLGVIPLSLLVLYVNLFIGEAELAEIPEGYEPKYWEYYKHPISRWISRYLLMDPQERYEVTLHSLNEDQEFINWRLQAKKVFQLQQERGDYKGWYHIPSNQGVYMRQARKEADYIEKQLGLQ